MVDNETYIATFIKSPAGEAILNELTQLYYDRPSYSKGDSHQTAYLEGQREVVSFILRKCALSQPVPEFLP